MEGKTRQSKDPHAESLEGIIQFDECNDNNEKPIGPFNMGLGAFNQKEINQKSVPVEEFYN